MTTAIEKARSAITRDDTQGKAPLATLDQWVTFLAVLDTGGFAQAGEYLHCSQSGVSYTINKLQERLGVQLFTMEGRKAILTEAGRALVDKVRVLLKDALELEAMAKQIAYGQDTEIRLTVDKAFPTSMLVNALGAFSRECPETLVRLQEAANLESDDLAEATDVAIGPQVPRDCLADFLMEVRLVAVAHPSHPLHELGRTLTQEDLRQETQVIITDSRTGDRHSGWVSSSGKWYVATMETASAVIKAGNCFGWLPEHMVEDAVTNGELKVLPLERGRVRAVPMYLIYPKNTGEHTATTQLAAILKQLCD